MSVGKQRVQLVDCDVEEPNGIIFFCDAEVTLMFRKYRKKSLQSIAKNVLFAENVWSGPFVIVLSFTGMKPIEGAVWVLWDFGTNVLGMKPQGSIYCPLKYFLSI